MSAAAMFITRKGDVVVIDVADRAEFDRIAVPPFLGEIENGRQRMSKTVRSGHCAVSFEHVARLSETGIAS